MKDLIRSILMKVLICAILVTFLSLVVSAFMPTFNNDVALGQFDNDDQSFMQLQMWNEIQNGVTVIQYIITVICGFFVGTDVYKFIKTKRKV